MSPITTSSGWEYFQDRILEVPATRKSPDKSRLGLYRMHDRFFSFWFKVALVEEECALEKTAGS